MSSPGEASGRFRGVSVVVPVYNEAQTVARVHAALSEVLLAHGKAYELVFVDDGSTDATPELLRGIHDRDPHARVIRFARNFGQRAAWTAGLLEAQGEIVATMDADGQMEPQDLPPLLSAIAAGADIASGWRRERHDPALRRLASRVSNWSLRRLGRLEGHDFGCSLRAYRGALLDQVEFGPRRLFNKALLMSLTNAHVEIPVRHYPRRKTRSRWAFGALVGFGVDNLITFGERFFLQAAVVAAVGGVSLACALVAVAALGFPTGSLVAALVAITGGMTGGLIALVGVAVSRVIREGSGHPRYIIGERLRHEGAPRSGGTDPP